MPSLPSFSENVLSMTRGDVFNKDRTKIKNGLLRLWGRCEAETLVLVAEVVPPVSSLCHKGKWRVPKFRSFLIKDGTENLLKRKASSAWEILSPDTHPSGEPITVVLARKTKPSLEMKLAY